MRLRQRAQGAIAVARSTATAAWPTPAPELDVERARAARAAGSVAEAERLLVELLERSPLHVGALALLAGHSHGAGQRERVRGALEAHRSA